MMSTQFSEIFYDFYNALKEIHESLFSHAATTFIIREFEKQMDFY